MKHEEENTIKAINALREDYPYAASILVYVVIERQLKQHLLDHANDSDFPVQVSINNRKKPIQLREAEILKDELSKMVLGKLEKLWFEISKFKKIEKSKMEISTDRNNIMHSNLYRKEEMHLPEVEREKKNHEHLDKAIKHLLYVFKDYSDMPLKECNGKLMFSI